MTENNDLKAKARAATAELPPPPRPVRAPQTAAAPQAPVPAVKEPEQALPEIAKAEETKQPETSETIPAAEVALPQATQAPAAKVSATEVAIADTSVQAGNALELNAVLRAVFGEKPPVFKIAALQSGYTAEIAALTFDDINRIQASSVDAHAARMKLLRTLYSRITEFSCGPMVMALMSRRTAA